MATGTTKEKDYVKVDDFNASPDSLNDINAVASSEETQGLEGQERVYGVQGDEEYKRKFDYTVAKTLLTKLIGFNDRFKQDVEVGRRIRLIDANVQELQAQGRLESDETYIPIRTIDTNISREQPSFISFLTQSRRLMIFQCLSDPTVDTTRIEKDFTTGMKYEGWITPHFRCLDGCQAYGMDYIEVEYNESKPLHVSLSQVGRDNLLYDVDAENFQSCDEVLRRYKVTAFQLKQWITEFGFDATQVNILVDKFKATEPNKTFDVYKRYCKYQGIVYVSWFTDSGDVSNWLKEPQKYFRGRRIQREVTEIVQEPIPIDDQGNFELVSLPQTRMEWEDVYETEYPFHPLLYRITEDKKLNNSKGRVFLDYPEQEALTAIWTASINGAVRSTNVYASPDGVNMGSGSEINQTNTKLFNGAIFDTPLKFYNQPPPDPELIKTAQQFSVTKDNERGQLNFAIANRKDSRKTAAEINTANQQQSLLSGVQVVLYSMHLQAVYTDAWRIVQSQALQGAVKFMLTAQQIQGELGQPQTVYVNDTRLIALDYKLVPAGETDVIEKAEMLVALKELIPMAQSVAPELALAMFKDVIEATFPNKAGVYVPILERAGDIRMLINGMFEIIKTLMMNRDVLKPEYAAYAPQLQALTQKAMPYLMPQEEEGQQ